MLTALILICSVSTTPDIRSCSRDNAVDAVQVPEAFANPATCFMRGQAYLADTSLGRDLTETERVKVVCVRTGSPPTVVGAAPEGAKAQ
jgi:hypothetical protein